MSVRALCEDCGWTGLWGQVLTAPNPFDEFLELCEIYGCPRCRGVNTLTGACDVDGCSRPASRGTPTPAGYRSTCWEHRPPEADEPRPSALTEAAMLREAEASVALDRDQTYSLDEGPRAEP